MHACRTVSQKRDARDERRIAAPHTGDHVQLPLIGAIWPYSYTKHIGSAPLYYNRDPPTARGRDKYAQLQRNNKKKSLLRRAQRTLPLHKFIELALLRFVASPKYPDPINARRKHYGKIDTTRAADCVEVFFVIGHIVYIFYIARCAVIHSFRFHLGGCLGILRRHRDLFTGSQCVYSTCTLRRIRITETDLLRSKRVLAWNVYVCVFFMRRVFSKRTDVRPGLLQSSH